MRVEELLKFMKERHAIYNRRKAGWKKPWTDDPILQRYRFCNVYREFDTQTVWFANNWRKCYYDNPDLWFASLMFRSINLSETAELIWQPLPWNRKMFIDAITEREAAKLKVYNDAYMISTHGVKQKKSEYIANSLDKIWKVRKDIRYVRWEGLSNFHEHLMKQFDVGSFLAGQVVADCKYAGDMTMADDWWTFAASGPGSKRGLNRVMGYPVKAAWDETMWRSTIRALQLKLENPMRNSLLPTIHAQDLQNCLCEFDKYERVRLGEGRPKQLYKGEK